MLQDPAKDFLHLLGIARVIYVVFRVFDKKFVVWLSLYSCQRIGRRNSVSFDDPLKSRILVRNDGYDEIAGRYEYLRREQGRRVDNGGGLFFFSESDRSGAYRVLHVFVRYVIKSGKIFL